MKNYSESSSIEQKVSSYLQCTTEIGLPIQSIQINHLVIGVFYLLLVIATITLNSLVLVAFLKLKRYKKVSDCLLVQLVCTGLVSAILAQAPLAIYNILLYYNRFSCLLQKYLFLVGYVFSFASVTNIVALTWEMYWSIKKPFLPMRGYRNYMKISIPAYTIFILLTVVAEFIFPATLWHSYSIFFLCTLVLVYLSICAINYNLYTEVTKIHRRDSGHNSELLVNMVNLARTVLIALGVTYLPYVLGTSLLAVWTLESIYRYIIPWCYFVSLSSTCINPLLFSLRLKDVKRTLRKVCSNSENKVHANSRNTEAIAETGC